jgi:hypothetical protein
MKEPKVRQTYIETGVVFIIQIKRARCLFFGTDRERRRFIERV